MEIVGVILVAVVVVALLAQGCMSDRKMTLIEHTLGSLPDFHSTQLVVGSDMKSGLSVDEDRNKVCLFACEGTLTHRIVDYNDIVSAEIFEDGSSVIHTVRSSQIGGVVLGGLVLGGVGAIIGGLSGKSKATDKVNKVELRLIVNDMKFPLHDVCFLNNVTVKRSHSHKKAIDLARHWYGLIEVLIRRADNELKTSADSNPEISFNAHSVSVADELKKLAQLRIEGVLSDAEFQQQKAKLLCN